MSVIMVIIDGAVPSDYKECTYINKASKKGYISNIPTGFESSSLSCIMNMLKVPVKHIPKGRAYLESLALNEELQEDDLLFRCNNVIIKNDILIGNKEESLNLYFKDFGKFKSLEAYKNILVLHNKKYLINEIKTYPPHQHFGEDINTILPICSNKELENFLRSLINKYHIFPWGESIKTSMLSFEEINKFKGAVVCKTEIVAGIAKALKMYCPEIKNTTADIDTDLEAKTKMALKLNKEYDFVLLHINGADESAHRKNEKEKLDFIKKIDEFVIKKLYENVDNKTSIIVTSDHGTCSATGTHLKSEVSYFIFNENREAGYWLKR